MLLRVGLAMMASSVLIATGVALVVGLSDPPATQDTWATPTAAETTPENGLGPGEKPEINEVPGGESPTPSSPEANPTSPREASGRVDPLPVSEAGWPLPKRDELDRFVRQPRYFGPDPNAAMTLTVETLGLHNVPVFDSFGEEALERGVMHVPDTAYPWEEADQKNVFLAGHRVGLPGTDGRLLFFALDELRSGDEIVLEDRGGNAYTYRVEETFKVEPHDAWVADALEGRDILTLQTCTYPTFEDRLIVRADRV